MQSGFAMAAEYSVCIPFVGEDALLVVMWRRSAGQ